MLFWEVNRCPSMMSPSVNSFKAKDCERANPPGVLIYEEGDVQIYEVFGALQKVSIYTL